jgi:hypothetical protein
VPDLDVLVVEVVVSPSSLVMVVTTVVVVVVEETVSSSATCSGGDGGGEAVADADAGTTLGALICDDRAPIDLRDFRPVAFGTVVATFVPGAAVCCWRKVLFSMDAFSFAWRLRFSSFFLPERRASVSCIWRRSLRTAWPTSTMSMATSKKMRYQTLRTVCHER